MDGSLMRTAIGCAVAFGAFAVGPLSFGAAVADAGVLGIGGGGDGVDVLGVDVLGGGSKKSGSGGTVARASSVSTAPSARSVVIRTKPAATQPQSTTAPAAFTAPAAQLPAVALGSRHVEDVPEAPPQVAATAPVPVSAPALVIPPAAPALDLPVPQGLPVTTTKQPGPNGLIEPAEQFSPPTKIPESFRVGYAEYLRAATTTDLLAAALPGAAGIAGFTLIGAFAGYRQAKAVQMALLAPVPTRVLL
jgi:hypothetical protein